MSKTLTTAKLYEHVLRKASLPSTQNTFQVADILAFANEEIDSSVIPYILTFKQDHFLYTELVALQHNVTAYSIPYRANGNKLRDVSMIDSANNVFEMTRVFIDDESQYKGTYYNTALSSPYSFSSFYVQGDEIVMLPRDQTMSIVGHLKFSYYIRNNELVEESRAGVISAIDTITGAITLVSTPDNFTNSIKYDFIQQRTPYKHLGIDKTAAVTGSVITFNPSDLPTNLQVGDYVMQAEETPVPQIPVELHNLLAQRIVCRCLEAIGDAQGFGIASARLKEMEENLGTVLSARVEAAAIKVNNQHSLLKRGRAPYRWR